MAFPTYSLSPTSLIQADAAHYLMTDSSSARQLAAKQGVGKIRHLDGKILWVQQHVLAGDVFFQQLPAIWNVADICTKSLPPTTYQTFAS